MLQPHVLRERIAPRKTLIALRPWARERFLPRMAPDVGNKGKARGLRQPTARAGSPLASIVRLVYADVRIMNVRNEGWEVREDDAAVIPETCHCVRLSIFGTLVFVELARRSS